MASFRRNAYPEFKQAIKERVNFQRIARPKAYQLAPVPKAGVEGTDLLVLPQEVASILIMARPMFQEPPPNKVEYCEQGVDELLQLKIYQAITGPDIPVGSTIVCATGNGGPGQFDKQGSCVSSIFRVTMFCQRSRTAWVGRLNLCLGRQLEWVIPLTSYRSMELININKSLVKERCFVSLE